MKKLMTLLLALLLSLSPLSAALAASGIPKEYIGDWRGSADGIYLSFSVDADGTGTYIFDQGSYRESYGFTLSVDSGSFAVQIPADNKLGIVSCEGSYTYADDTLTLRVKTTMSGGRVFEYTVPCKRDALINQAAALPDAPQPQPFPETGRISGSTSGTKVIVKVLSDGLARYIQLRNDNTGDIMVSAFIRPGGSCTLYVPRGDCYVLYASGTAWYGEKLMFGNEGSYRRSVTFEVKGSDYFHTITLGTLKAGGMSSYDANMDDFR